MLIARKDMDAVHIAVEPSHLVREGIARCGVIHEDEVLVLPIALHHRLQGTRTTTVVHHEVVGLCQLILLAQLCEVGQGIKLFLFHPLIH